jgi:hypothetical protein
MVTSLGALVARVEPVLSAMNEADVTPRPAPGKWSKKEILGHLIDSAANNHQRFVRLQLADSIALPGYEQDNWVRVNQYQRSSWADVLALWAAYNRHLAAVIERFDEKALGHVWHGPDGDVTLEFLAEDYVEHLRHHLKQIGLDV